MAGTTSNFIEKSNILASEAQAWVSGNLVGILVAASIGVAIALALAAAAVVALALIGLRALGQRMVRNRAPDVHWRNIFARVLA